MNKTLLNLGLCVALLCLHSCKPNSNTNTAAEASTANAATPPTVSAAEKERLRQVDALDQELTLTCFSDIDHRLLLRFYIYPDGHTDGWKFLNGKSLQEDEAVASAMKCAMTYVEQSAPDFGPIQGNDTAVKKAYSIKIN